jgi:hypothetical protein
MPETAQARAKRLAERKRVEGHIASVNRKAALARKRKAALAAKAPKPKPMSGWQRLKAVLAGSKKPNPPKKR